ncbi:helix-turn-helix domain-containing protein [Solihabitans fulvus]|uniref:Helix-turn-helix domain-containing protein n=1 Tax=Solihabitans fulvus TaxID=1892852 RepID=A0A5B2W3R0_9PSEU|nr:helix-turn-helix domain-containing protein [Solihabitans fulvus]KAA2245985.1 helix-turn-helix domain-containing protein [Solihabitans fulvus]
MHTVALALSDGVPLFELAAPCAIFGGRRAESAESWYEFVVCGQRGARVDRWFTAATEHTYEDLVAADTVIVPACHDSQHRPPADLVAAVRAAHDNGARIVSICTGAFVLAEAGLLDDRRAATHWLYASMLAARYPAVTVDPAVLYVDEGDVLTSAGKAAGTDLCLHVVRRDHGAAAANQIARRLVTAPHREGGQAQYSALSVPRSAQDDLAPVLDWAIENLDQPITVEELAAKARLGTRTLNRHFHARLGTNPLQWLHNQRIRRAQELLEQTDLAVDTVARRSGFGTGAALRRHFRRALDTSPDAYRRTFAQHPAARGDEVAVLSELG